MIVDNIVIEVEGIDKTGKDTLVKYIANLSDYKYTIHARGILSQLVYNDKYNRDYTYRLSHKPLIILLDVDDDDHAIRCKLTNEPAINKNIDNYAFIKYSELLEYYGFTVLRYNTSELTPINIAYDVLNYIQKNCKSEDFICNNVYEISNLNIYKKGIKK